LQENVTEVGHSKKYKRILKGGAQEKKWVLNNKDAKTTRRGNGKSKIIHSCHPSKAVIICPEGAPRERPPVMPKAGLKYNICFFSPGEGVFNKHEEQYAYFPPLVTKLG
jgi:hypothetical protein